MTEVPPIRLEVDFPPRHGRWSVLFRAVLALPVYFLVSALIGPWFLLPSSKIDFVWYVVGAGWAPGFLGALMLATGAMITVRRRYPRWWFDAHAEIVRFGIRFLAYLLLLTDRYPSTDTESDVRVFIETPLVESNRDRRIALVKWLLAAPHFALLYLLLSLAYLATVVVWVMLLVGRPYPRSLFAFVAGTIGYALRIYGYAFLHLTDRYPQFGPTSPVAEVVDRPPAT